MTDPLNIIFDDLDIYSTRALYHKYVVARKYRWICTYFLFWVTVHLLKIRSKVLSNSYAKKVIILFSKLRNTYLIFYHKKGLLTDWISNIGLCVDDLLLSVLPSICLHVYPSLHRSTCLSFSPSIYLYVLHSISLPVCPSLHLSTCISFPPSVYLSVLPSISLPVHHSLIL